MFQSNNQLTVHTKAVSIQDSSALVHVGQNDSPVIARDEMQNGAFCKAESIVYTSKKLQDDLKMLGLKIKQHEDNIKFLKTQKNSLDDSILDMQVNLGKYHSSSVPKTENEDLSHIRSEEEIVEHILRHEKSAAGILCQLKTRHGTQASHLPLTKDVLGIVATLGKVDDDNLSRLLSEYLGMETMLAVVCKSYDGVKALETYDKEGFINKSFGLHGLGASIGRPLDGRFLVICLENLRPYVGEFVADDPQRKLDLLKPKLSSGESPPGFLGFAVNLINVDSMNLFCLTANGHGLRETLFYNLFSRLQVYRTRADMLQALPCISDGAVSLDGGMIRNTGVFSLGSREDVDVKFPKSSGMSNLPENYFETEKRIKEIKWEKERLLEDMQREQAVLDHAKFNFEIKKQEFVKFLAESSPYATQMDSRDDGGSNLDNQVEMESLDKADQYFNQPAESSQIPAQMGSTTKKGQRSHNFTTEEDNLLVSAWLNINPDANEQKSKTYWQRMFEYFHKYKKFISQRSSISLMHRWSTIQLAIKKFGRCHAQIEARHQSGVSELDKIIQAKLMYHEMYHASFQFEHCWNELRYEPKWLELAQKKKAKKSSSASPCASSPSTPDLINLGEDDVQGDSFVDLERSLGRKVQKQQLEKQRNKERVDDNSIAVLIKEKKVEKKQMNDKKMEFLESSYAQERETFY